MQKHRIFCFLGTKITVDPLAFLPMLNAFVLGTIFSKRETSWQRGRTGLLSVVAYKLGDFTHLMGHILSSRLADAPMDEVQFTAPFAASIWHDESVTPDQHRLRAIGGPVLSTVALVFTWLDWRVTKPGTVSREFFSISMLVHALLGIGASLTPLPIIDGGSLLKWSWVARGRSEDEADQLVEQTNLGLGGLLAGLGLLWLKQGKQQRGWVTLFLALPMLIFGLRRFWKEAQL